MEKSQFKAGDPVIWDSNFGYDVGYFVSESNMYYHYRVTLVSGVSPGNDVTVNVNQVHPYSEEMIKTLTQKYGYRKQLADGK